MYLSPQIEAYIIPIVEKKLKELFPNIKTIHVSISYANFISVNFDEGNHKYYKYIETEKSVEIFVDDNIINIEKEGKHGQQIC